jgi:ferredoxin-NADP reductase
MRAIISLPLAGLFIFLAGFNAWIMLTGRGASPRSRGRFYFDETKHERIVMIAGGSGITPMLAMLRHIDDLCIVVPATLIYCVRSREDAFFQNELAGLSETAEQVSLRSGLISTEFRLHGMEGSIAA